MKVQSQGEPVANEVRDAVSTIRQVARATARSRWVDRGARMGMLARSVVYLLISWLALQIAFGHRGKEADQNGALRSVAGRTGGREILIALAAAFAVYALWRLTVVFFGEAGTRDVRTRLDGVIGFVGYGSLCVTAVSLIVGAGNQSGGSARQATTFTARIMKHSWGRVNVILSGIVVAVVGALLVVEGVRRSFLKRLRTEEIPPAAAPMVTVIGVVGNVARGVVVTIVGALLVDAGWTFDPQKSRGLDGALQTLAHTDGGAWLLGAVAVGLLAFALYSVSEFRYRLT